MIRPILNMKLTRFCSIILFVIFALLLDLPTASAVDTVAEKTEFSLEQEFNAELRKRPKRKRRRRRRRRRRRKKKKLDPALVAAREKVIRERIFRGGKKVLEPSYQAPNVSIQPLTKRFREGDKKLDVRSLAYLYYQHEDVEIFKNLNEVELKKLNRAIEIRSFSKALGICKEQLYFSPMNLTLLSKACELAHHLKDESYERYTWQLTELLYTISTSGDGRTDATPYRLHTILDIIRFEELWLETNKNDILELKIHPLEKGNLVKLFFKDKEGERQVRYYQLV